MGTLIARSRAADAAVTFRDWPDGSPRKSRFAFVRVRVRKGSEIPPREQWLIRDSTIASSGRARLDHY